MSIGARGCLSGLSGFSGPSNQTDRIDPRNHIDQLPATRREMGCGAYSFHEIQNVSVFLPADGLPEFAMDSELSVGRQRRF